MCQNLLVPVEIFTERHLTFMMDLSSSVVHFSSVQKHICSLFFSQYYFFCFHQSWFENLPVRPAFITNLSCTNFVVKSLLQNIWKVNVFIWKIEKFWQIVLVLPLYHRNSNGCLTQSGPLSLVQECRGSSLIGRELPQWCWRQLSYAIMNQLGHPEPPTARKGPIIGALMP